MKATATEVKRRFGEYLDRAQREPVEIERSGRVVGVLVSVEEYRALVRSDDMVWALAARAAAEGDLASDDDVARVLQRHAALDGDAVVAVEAEAEQADAA